MRRSSQIGFGASIGLAIFSASFVADFSPERKWYSFWSQASASVSGATALITHSWETPHSNDRQILPSKLRRQALLNNVLLKLRQDAEAVDPILP